MNIPVFITDVHGDNYLLFLNNFYNVSENKKQKTCDIVYKDDESAYAVYEVPGTIYQVKADIIRSVALFEHEKKKEHAFLKDLDDVHTDDQLTKLKNKIFRTAKSNPSKAGNR